MANNATLIDRKFSFTCHRDGYCHCVRRTELVALALAEIRLCNERNGCNVSLQCV